MKILIHDRDEGFEKQLEENFDQVIHADGRYAPCQGCFHCWTKTPASCEMKDALHEICRVIGQADELTIVTENWYGGYSPAVKNLLDRSIGTSTPLSTYRGGEMHHTLRYGRHQKWTVLVYGDLSENEKNTWQLMAHKNAINDGFESSEVFFIRDIDKPERSML